MAAAATAAAAATEAAAKKGMEEGIVWLKKHMAKLQKKNAGTCLRADVDVGSGSDAGGGGGGGSGGWWFIRFILVFNLLKSIPTKTKTY